MLLIFFSDKIKYMVMSRDRNAVWGHSVKIDNSATERWKSSILTER